MSKLTREQIIEILASPPENGEFYDFRNVDFSGLDLSNIDFKRADLTDANLTGANLTGADLTDADLRHNLNNNNEFLGTTIRGFYYSIYFNPKLDLVSIGCKTYPIERWMGFNDEKINEMDRNALSFWKENKEKVKALFEALKSAAVLK